MPLNDQRKTEKLLKTLLSEQKTTRELLKVLQDNKMQKEELQIGALIKYVDNMQAQHEQMLTEMENMKVQLQRITDPKLKSEVGDIVSQSETQTKGFGSFLKNAKIKIGKLFSNALETFKNFGVNALRKFISAMGIAPMLKNMEQKMHQNADSCIHKAIRLENIWKELYQTKAHIKNLGRALIGKAPAEEVAPQKGIIKNIMDKSEKYVSKAETYEKRENILHDRRVKVEEFLAGNHANARTQPQLQYEQTTQEMEKQQDQGENPVRKTEYQKNQESQLIQETENRQDQGENPVQETEYQKNQESQLIQETENQQDQGENPVQETGNQQKQNEQTEQELSTEQLAAVIKGMQLMMQELSQRFARMEKAAAEQSSSMDIPLQLPNSLNKEKFNEIIKEWKADGAKFDNQTKTWYVSPENKNMNKFHPYIKRESSMGKMHSNQESIIKQEKAQGREQNATEKKEPQKENIR